MFMIDESADSPEETTMQFDSNWHGRLDELVRGKCSEDEFMDDMSALREARPDSAWDVVALLSQRYRRFSDTV